MQAFVHLRIILFFSILPPPARVRRPRAPNQSEATSSRPPQLVTMELTCIVTTQSIFIGIGINCWQRMVPLSPRFASLAVACMPPKSASERARERGQHEQGFSSVSANCNCRQGRTKVVFSPRDHTRINRGGVVRAYRLHIRMYSHPQK
jgi:hypothetical protein